MYCTWKSTKCRKSKTTISPLRKRSSKEWMSLSFESVWMLILKKIVFRILYFYQRTIFGLGLDHFNLGLLFESQILTTSTLILYYSLFWFLPFTSLLRSLEPDEFRTWYALTKGNSMPNGQQLKGTAHIYSPS